MAYQLRKPFKRERSDRFWVLGSGFFAGLREHREKCGRYETCPDLCFRSTIGTREIRLGPWVGSCAMWKKNVFELKSELGRIKG